MIIILLLIATRANASLYRIIPARNPRTLAAVGLIFSTFA